MKLRESSLDLDHLGIHRGRGGFAGCLDGDELVGLIAEPFVQSDQVVLAEIVVLIEHADGLARIILQDVGGIDACFDLVARLPADGPREVLRIVPFGGAAGDAARVCTTGGTLPVMVCTA